MTDEELEKVARAVRQFDEMTYADFMDAATPKVVLALLERVRMAEARVRELEEVAREVESMTADAAENGNCADCPYVPQERARELLALIRKGR